MKASVYKTYGDAAIMNIVLESLPKVIILSTITIIKAISTNYPLIITHTRVDCC